MQICHREYTEYIRTWEQLLYSSASTLVLQKLSSMFKKNLVRMSISWANWERKTNSRRLVKTGEISLVEV